jgi:hypothetical protein
MKEVARDEENSLNWREGMPKEIRCPDCESLNVEEIPDKVTPGPEEAYDELAKETKSQKYECLDCRLIFFTSNFKE